MNGIHRYYMKGRKENNMKGRQENNMKVRQENNIIKYDFVKTKVVWLLVYQFTPNQ